MTPAATYLAVVVAGVDDLRASVNSTVFGGFEDL
jgi:hypothetical protein